MGGKEVVLIRVKLDCLNVNILKLVLNLSHLIEQPLRILAKSLSNYHNKELPPKYRECVNMPPGGHFISPPIHVEVCIIHHFISSLMHG